MKESSLLRELLAYRQADGIRLYRNNVGLFYTREGMPVRSGLCVGSSDLIGWTPVTIIEQHLGTSLAVFTAIETKSARGRVSMEQAAFIAAVCRAGGIATAARSPLDVDAAIRSVTRR